MRPRAEEPDRSPVEDVLVTVRRFLSPEPYAPHLMTDERVLLHLGDKGPRSFSPAQIGGFVLIGFGVLFLFGDVVVGLLTAGAGAGVVYWYRERSADADYVITDRRLIIHENGDEETYSLDHVETARVERASDGSATVVVEIGGTATTRTVELHDVEDGSHVATLLMDVSAQLRKATR